MTHQTLLLSDVIELLNNNVRTVHPKIVVILESSENVNSYLALKKNDKNYTLMCIAASPDVCYALDKENEKYVSIDDYFTSEEISELGLSNFTKVEYLCEIIDQNICKDHTIFNYYSLKPAYDNFYFLKVLFDVVTIKIETVAAIIKKEIPSIIISFSKKPYSPTYSYLPFQPDETLFDTLLCQKGWPCQHISIDCNKPLITCKEKKNRICRRELVIKKIRMHFPSIYGILFTYSEFGARKSIDLLWNVVINSIKRGKIVCIAGFGYEWNYIINELIHHNYRVIYLNYESKQQKEPKLMKIQIPKNAIQNLCTINNIDFSDFFIERLNPALEFSSKAASEFPQEIEKFFFKNHPYALLCRSSSIFIDHLPVHVAHNHKIPVISWQYGAAGYFNYPLLKYTELTGCNLYLVWGPGVQSQIDEEFDHYNCRILPTGSFSLQEEFQNKTDKTCYKILYVTTNYFNNSLYVGYSHKVQDNTLWITQKKIIDVLGSCSDKTVFKVHPGNFQNKHFYEYIIGKDFNHITIIKDGGSVSSLARISEIIIIDFPTTSMLQAIATKKKVFVLLKHLILTNKAKELLMKRAYCADDLDEFIEMVNCYLNGKPLQQKPDEQNTEFLEEYGIVKKDGKVIERVIDAIDHVYDM